MLCCGSSKSRNISKDAQMAQLRQATKFTTQDINELRKRFYRMSNGNQDMTKEQFRENMGLLGLDTVYFLADRIFSILDDDKNGKIRFEEFVYYFDKITNGDQMEKSEISFKLIDQNKTGYFNLMDFTITMHGLIESWIVMTGQPIAKETQARLDLRIKEIFQQMDVNLDDKVSLVFHLFKLKKIEYQEAVMKDPTLLDIFQFLKKGISKSIQEAQFQREQIIIEEFTVIQEQTLSIYNFMLGIDNSQRAQQLGVQLPNNSIVKERISVQQLLILIIIQKEKIKPSDKHKHLNQAKQIPKSQMFLESLIFQEMMMRFQIKGIHLYQGYNHHKFQKKSHNPQGLGTISRQCTLFLIIRQIESGQNINLQKNQSSNRMQQPEQEGIVEGEIGLRIHSKVIVRNQEKKSPKAINFSNRQFNGFLKSDQDIGIIKIEEQNFENDIDEVLQQMSPTQLKAQYKQTLIKLKSVSDTMKNAVNKLEEHRNEKEEEYLQKQEKQKQLIQLRIRTAANIHKSSAKLIKAQKNDKGQQIQKKQLSVQFGHENWNLVLNMMLGIQMAVKSVNAVEDMIINDNDFLIRYYFELLPRRSSQDKETFKICKFYDYAPQVFNQIRRFNGIDNEDYLTSIGPETLLSSLLKGDLSTLQELTSSGKSGSFFYYSGDGRFTLKTIHRDEFIFLKSILKNYYEHLKMYNQTLMIRFYGMHKISMNTKDKLSKIYFIIMSNVFHTVYEIHSRFDLKGSMYKRSTNPELDQSVARKDLDFLQQNIKINVEQKQKKEFLDQLNHDCNFFWKNNIIDYSLLVGIHNVKNAQDQESNQNNLHIQQESVLSVYSEVQQEYSIPDCISVMKSVDDSKIYYFGIIDTLTNFNAKKKIEFVAKRIAFGPTISAVPPSDYALRFMSFMETIFSVTSQTENQGAHKHN